MAVSDVSSHAECAPCLNHGRAGQENQLEQLGGLGMLYIQAGRTFVYFEQKS